MSARFSSCHTHCVCMRQHVGTHFNTHRNPRTGHSLLSIPTVNSLVIHYRFRMFSDGGGSLVNMQPTCWQEDVERCQVFSAWGKLIPQFAWLFVQVHVVYLNLHFAMVSLRFECWMLVSCSQQYTVQYRIIYSYLQWSKDLMDDGVLYEWHTCWYSLQH